MKTDGGICIVMIERIQDKQCISLFITFKIIKFTIFLSKFHKIIVLTVSNIVKIDAIHIIFGP